VVELTFTDFPIRVNARRRPAIEHPEFMMKRAERRLKHCFPDYRLIRL
jgi:hypothetical protein